jgi:4'-phosphopantetheinyl transferase
MVIPGGIATPISLSSSVPPTCNVWLVSIDLRAPLPLWSNTSLNEEEIAKIYRYQNHADRLRSWVARHSTRLLLGQAMGMSPNQIRLCSDKYGKPYVLGVSDISFNVSHSGEYILISITDWPSVGVDIEKKRDDLPDHASIHADLLSPAEVARDRARMPDFWSHWTLKEAALKALGTGLSSGLHSITIVPSRKCNGYRIDHENPRWPAFRAWDLAVPTGYVGAIAGVWRKTLPQ